MSKLFIDNNGVQVPVAELGLISSKEQTIIGNAQRDLILRTAGNVAIQVGNKFYSLLGNTDGSVTTDRNSTIILTNVSDIDGIPIPEDGTFVYITSTNSLYVVSGGVYRLITSSDPSNPNNGAQKIYLSYLEEQTLTGDDKYRVALNLGSIVDTFDDLLEFNTSELYPNQIVFVVARQRHYIYTGGEPSDSTSWSELYIHKTGGTVTGDLTVQNILRVDQDYLSNYYDPTTFKGFYLGKEPTKGLAIWNNDDVNIATIDGSSQIKFLTNTSDQANVMNPLIIGGNSVGVGGLINYGYRFSVSGNTLLNTVDIGDTVSSTNFISGMTGVGFSLYGSNEKTLEIDNLIVRKSLSVTNSTQYESKGVNGSYISGNEVIITSVEMVDEYLHYLDATKVGLALADGSPYSLYDRYKYYYGEDETGNYGLYQSILFGDRDSSGNLAPYTLYNINPDDGSLVTPQGKYSFDSGTNTFIEDSNGNLVLFTVATYKIKLTRNDIAVNDLLIYKRWDVDGNVTKDSYLLVYDVTDEGVFVYATNEPLLNDKFVHVSKTLIQYDKDSIDQVDNINNFGDIIYSAYYEDIENPDGQLLTYTTEFWDEDIRTKIGNLKSSYDLDLDIPDNTIGFYSDNAYIRGNIVANKLILGGDLTWDGTTLIIQDLETIKNRTITGSNGLTGGGTLFTNNIVIEHGTSSWVDKTDLTGATVISNLVVDDYGHITDWETRDIPFPTLPDITMNGGDMEFRISGDLLMKLNSTGLYLKSGVEVYPNNF